MRRRIALAELEGGVAEVVEHLADRRLLTVSDGAVEVAHEALLREWPRLRAWLAEDAEGRRLHRGLGDAARAWDADARDPGGLYRGARLAAALDWAAGHAAELSATERAFLDDSRSASGRAQRRLRMMLAGVAVAARARRDRRTRGARPARRRARRGDHGRGAAARRPGARGREPRPRAAARPPGRGARRLGADARQPARHAAQEPRRDRRDRRRRRPADEPRPQPATGARWRSSTPTGRWPSSIRRPGAGRRRAEGSRASSGARSGSTWCASATTARCSRSPGTQPVVIDARDRSHVVVAPDVADRRQRARSRRTGGR